MMVDPVTAQAAIPARQVELAPAMPQQAGQDAAADFAASLKVAATEHIGGTDMSPALRGMLGTLDKVNGEAKSVADYARSVEGTGGELTPGEVVQLTMRCQEFMFHCQLTSNIANRSSEGVQQLFRQQG
ncbi:hypothetical protein NYF14_05845 [Sphingobium sp. 10 DY56-G10]|jgi:hypothetical protein|uniref:Type III secretion protein HrpB2 n=1 Tax=Sphingobium soli TaxID=1591116 RepID=A0ABS8H542_9SPHN|nr:MULTISPECIES: hypothetical protein [Sphingomonadaceae]EAT08799.1 hypothetical protein SKA58_16513 [Sphingomonas sp. SKA58]MCC4232233.1 hypothetical protein [Sphingobium soli]